MIEADIMIKDDPMPEFPITVYDTFPWTLFGKHSRAKDESSRRFLEMQILVEAREFAQENGDGQD